MRHRRVQARGRITRLRAEIMSRTRNLASGSVDAERAASHRAAPRLTTKIKPRPHHRGATPATLAQRTELRGVMAAEQWLIEISPKRIAGPVVTETFGDDFWQCFLRAYQLVNNLSATHDIS